MRYRDQPTVEVTRVLPWSPEISWERVTDIALPTRTSTELHKVEWLDGATHVEAGARFRGHCKHHALGEWSTECTVVEVDPGSRWVWQVDGPDGASATWGFEVEPSRQGSLVRQWGRMGPGPSGLTFAILATPEKEGRIVARRLAEWAENMQATLDHLAAQANDELPPTSRAAGDDIPTDATAGGAP